MDKFFCGLLLSLEHRCSVLRDRLAAMQTDPVLSEQARLAYQEVEQVRRDVQELLTDPDLGASIVLRNQLQRFQRWNEQILQVEAYLFPLLERFTEHDQKITELCRHLTAQIGWPLLPPLVVACSQQYYWTQPQYNTIWVPAAEGTTLLGLPDLCHELGHILLLHHEAILTGAFIQELVAYILQEQRRVETQQRPPDYRALYDQLLVQWLDEWLREFVADMVATYLVGPAYGWQHVRLCSGSKRTAYHPALEEKAVHPADEARLRAILEVLNLLAPRQTGERIKALWDSYLAASGETMPPEYMVCYPDSLLASLAADVVAGCQTLGLQSFKLGGDADQNLPSLFLEAWERFLADPQTYDQWELPRLEALWKTLH